MKKEPVIANRRSAASEPHTDSFSPSPRRVMHERTVIVVAGVALLAACTTPFVPATASADYPADKKKYDDCVAREKIDYPVPPGMSYWLEGNIRKACGEPPTRPKDEKK
jgi:hypothetical protein